VSSLNIGAPTISHHIEELVNADLIRTEKKGKFLICKINKELIEEVSKCYLYSSNDLVQVQKCITIR